jgi:hypothetical protein
MNALRMLGKALPACTLKKDKWREQAPELYLYIEGDFAMLALLAFFTAYLVTLQWKRKFSCK